VGTGTGTGGAAVAAARGGGGGGGGAGGGGKGQGRAGVESVFCYVNSCFAPGGDEVVGNLWRVSNSCWGCLLPRGREWAVGGEEG